MAKLIGWPFVVQALETPNEPASPIDGLEVREVMNPWLEYVFRWEMIPYGFDLEPLKPVNPLCPIGNSTELMRNLPRILPLATSEDRVRNREQLLRLLCRDSKRLT